MEKLKEKNKQEIADEATKILDFIKNHVIKHMPPQAVTPTHIHHDLQQLPQLKYNRKTHKFTRGKVPPRRKSMLLFNDRDIRE